MNVVHIINKSNHTLPTYETSVSGGMEQHRCFDKLSTMTLGRHCSFDKLSTMTLGRYCSFDKLSYRLNQEASLAEPGG